MRFLTTLATLTVLTIALPWTAQPVAAQQVVKESITCESTNRQRVECPVNGRLRAVRQTAAIGGGFCLQGFSWGYESGHVWVDLGCSGTFDVEVQREVTAERQQRRAARQTFTEALDCRAQGRQRLECPVDGRIENVEPVGSFTSIPCRYGTSWGYERRHVWVERGCEARFNVTFTRRIAEPAPEPAPARRDEPQVTRDKAPARGIADAALSDIVAQGACTGLYPSLGSGGFVFAVPRECSQNAPDCSAVCKGITQTVETRSWRKRLSSRKLGCFNSVHVYANGPGEVGGAGLRSYVYNSCGGQCGPNYCCCSAE